MGLRALEPTAEAAFLAGTWEAAEHVYNELSADLTQTPEARAAAAALKEAYNVDVESIDRTQDARTGGQLGGQKDAKRGDTCNRKGDEKAEPSRHRRRETKTDGGGGRGTWRPGRGTADDETEGAQHHL